MLYRILGRTGLSISTIAVGAGPVSGLMTGDEAHQQLAVLQRAAQCGINWIDTAAGYGQGKSEANLGRALRELGSHQPFHIATKVRIALDDSTSIIDQVRRSFDASLERLGQDRVTLLQLHNAITVNRGDEAASLSVDDVMGSHGVLAALQMLRSQRRVDFIGLTGTGHPEFLRKVIQSGDFHTMQVPYHVLNPSAARRMPAGFEETDYGRVIEDCADQQMGVLAIRVLAAGALLGNPPSAHTLVTPYFPLALYQRDTQRAQQLARTLPGNLTIKQAAVRYALSQPAIQSAIIGMATPQQVEELAALADLDRLSPEDLAHIEQEVDALYQG